MLFGIGESCSAPRSSAEARIKIGKSTYECVSVEEVKTHLGLHPMMTEDDTLISGLIKSVCRACEKYSQQAFMETPFTQTQTRIVGDSLEISSASYLLEITAFEYLPNNGTSTFVAWPAQNFRINTLPACILTLGVGWPTSYQKYGIKITGKIGYAAIDLSNAVDPDNPTEDEIADAVDVAREEVPDDIRVAVKMWAAYLYEHRAGESEAAQIPTDAQELIKIMPPAIFNLMTNYAPHGHVGV